MFTRRLLISVPQAMVRTATRRTYATGEKYVVPQQAFDDFHTKGYAILPNFLTEEEIKPLEVIYDKFMNREIPVPGKDFCDMSQGFGVPYEKWQIINAMLPRVYYPPLQNNIYEKRAASVAAQLFPAFPMALDYDQLLNKRPGKPGAIFAWHQDMAYWPRTARTETVTFSLAIDTTTAENGALKFIPGSGKPKTIFPHKPIGKTRDEAHAIAIEVDESKENIQMACIKRGDVTIHDEWVVHGSGGNLSKGPRRTYVAAFRPLETVKRERAAGFTHSHNDSVNWDSFNKWQEDESGSKGNSV